MIKPTNIDELPQLVRAQHQTNANAKRHCDVRIIAIRNSRFVLEQWSNCSTIVKRIGWQEWYCPSCKCQLKIGKRR